MADEITYDDDKKGSSPRVERIKLILAILFVLSSFVIFGFALAHYLKSRDELIKFQQQHALTALRQELTNSAKQ